MKINRVGCIYAVVLENQDGERRICQPVTGDEVFEDLWARGFPDDLPLDHLEVRPDVPLASALTIVHPSVLLRCGACGTEYSDDGVDCACPKCGPLPVPKVATSGRDALARIHGMIVLWRKDDDPPTYSLLDDIYKIAAEGLR